MESVTFSSIVSHRVEPSVLSSIVSPWRNYRKGNRALQGLRTSPNEKASVQVLENPKTVKEMALQPASGTPIPGKDVVICKYPSDPTVTLGGLSIACLFLTTVFGVASVFYPYRKKSVPLDALQRNTALVVFFVIALLVSILAMSFFIWATTTESLHLKYNVHRNLKNDCPTAKTGLFGGAAFLALDSALFWLVCQMLTHNAREDYEEDDLKGGNYGQVLVSDYAPAGDAHARSV